METNKIYQGNALEVLKTFPNESINCVMTDYEIGFLEGLIDGEGSLYIGFNKQKTSNNPRIYISLSISNTNLELLEKAHKIIGFGKIHKETLRPNRKQSYSLYIHTNGLRKILSQINLTAKREQQKLIIEAISLLEDRRKGKFKGFAGGLRRPEWKQKRFSEIIKEMHKLNKRGRKDV